MRKKGKLQTKKHHVVQGQINPLSYQPVISSVNFQIKTVKRKNDVYDTVRERELEILGKIKGDKE